MADEVKKEASEEEDESLPFPNAAVMRIIKSKTGDKLIKKRVRLSMNKLLGEVCLRIASEMAKKPYSYIDYPEFLEAAKPFLEVDKLIAERKKLVTSLEKISADAHFLALDLSEEQGISKEKISK